MTATIDQHFIRDYDADAHMAFQRGGSFLRNAVRVKEGIEGKSTTFQVLGKGSASTKARGGDIPDMNATASNVECVLTDLYAAQHIDVLDELKTNVDERMLMAKTGASALGRSVDDQITAKMSLTTQTAVVLPATPNSATVRKFLLELVKGLDANDVDPAVGNRYAALTANMWALAETVEQFSSIDYVSSSGMPFVDGKPSGGRWRLWNGVLWGMHNGLPGAGTATAECFAWDKNAVGHASQRVPGSGPMDVEGMTQIITARVDYDTQKGGHKVLNAISSGACLIDDTGVIKGTFSDLEPIPTS